MFDVTDVLLESRPHRFTFSREDEAGVERSPEGPLGFGAPGSGGRAGFLSLQPQRIPERVFNFLTNSPFLLIPAVISQGSHVCGGCRRPVLGGSSVSA